MKTFNFKGNLPTLHPKEEQANNVMIRTIKARRSRHPVYTVGKVVRIVGGDPRVYPVGALGRILERVAYERVLLISLLKTGKTVAVPEWLCDVPKERKHG